MAITEHGQATKINAQESDTRLVNRDQTSRQWQPVLPRNRLGTLPGFRSQVLCLYAKCRFRKGEQRSHRAGRSSRYYQCAFSIRHQHESGLQFHQLTADYRVST